MAYVAVTLKKKKKKKNKTDRKRLKLTGDAYKWHSIFAD